MLHQEFSKDSATKVSASPAKAKASSILEAYCRICLARMETGVFDKPGMPDFAALRVTTRPWSFIPDTTPIIPPQVMKANL